MKALKLLALAGIIFGAVVVRTQAEDNEEEEVISHEDLPANPEEVPYVTPEIHPKIHFADHFDGSDFGQKWTRSSAKKEGADSGIDQ